MADEVGGVVMVMAVGRGAAVEDEGGKVKAWDGKVAWQVEEKVAPGMKESTSWSAKLQEVEPEAGTCPGRLDLQLRERRWTERW